MIIISNILLVFFVIATCLLGYVVYNLDRKYEFLENKLLEFFEKAENVYKKMNEIDVRGSFSSDDEVGFAFKEMKSLIEQLYDFIIQNTEKENNDDKK